MNLNNPETKLKDLIYISKNIIPSETCDYIIKETEKQKWDKHSWYASSEKISYSMKDKELDIQPITPELLNILVPYMVTAGSQYNEQYCFNNVQIMNKFTKIRFNRYSPGQIMRQHYDHINLNDNLKEEQKGIPILSFIGNLNDDYEGADLYFWDDYIVPLGKGDIVMFPSLFLFPHGVTEPTKGIRRSFVSWAF